MTTGGLNEIDLLVLLCAVYSGRR